VQLHFHRSFAAPAPVVWAHLCEPDLMNRWSQAKVQLKAPGQSGHPGGPGAHRRVFVQAARRSFVLDEVIRDARPPHRLTYQVIDAVGLRSHLGTIEIEDRDLHGARGCELHWQVEFEFLAPGADTLVSRLLRRKLGDSLDTLQTLLRGHTTAIVLPQWRSVPEATEEDWRRGDDVLRAQRALAKELDARDDPKKLFAHIYSFVSEGILDGCRRGDFVYPVWALRLLPIFHEYYWDNYQRWCGLRAGPAEAHWQRAFHVVENGTSRYPGPGGQLLSGLILSIHAHVESDLPRSLAEVYCDHFAHSSDYGRFRGDYYCMGQIFIRAAAQVQTLIPSEYLPRWARSVRSFVPEELVQLLIYRKSYDLPKQRRHAFRRGAELADMLVRRSGSGAP
jgi:uncharacterized protein YndB with AHSA1/START domain